MTETSDIEETPRDAGESPPSDPGESSPSNAPAEGAVPVEAERPYVYHLYLDPAEAEVAMRALRLLVAGEAHEPLLRRLARDALQKVSGEPEANGILTVPLSPEEMKISHTAFRLLLDDLQREQSDERRLLQGILDKLPDEHAIRAIVLD